MLVAERQTKRHAAPEERHNVPLLRSLKERNGDEYYQHFAPNGAKTAHLFL